MAIGFVVVTGASAVWIDAIDCRAPWAASVGGSESEAVVCAVVRSVAMSSTLDRFVGAIADVEGGVCAAS